MGTKAHSQKHGIQLASRTPAVTQEKPLVPLIISRIQRLGELTQVSCGREAGLAQVKRRPLELGFLKKFSYIKAFKASSNKNFSSVNIS